MVMHVNVKDPRAGDRTFVFLCTTAFAVIIIAGMFFGRAILVPVALAVLLTFMLSPLVGKLERHIGRGPAVFGLALVVFAGVGTAGWVITRQTMDLMSKLPDYRTNIERKIQAIAPAKDSPFKRFSQMVVEMESELPGAALSRFDAPSGGETPLRALPGGNNAAPVAVPVAADPASQWRALINPFVEASGTAGVVLLLVIFMLFKREDLRARFVKIVGHARISTTTRAMEDAGDRVARYLIAQLIVNMAFGAAVALGLILIGVPNAFLWGMLAAVLRFIPYVGVAIAAIGPLALALAVSPGWGMVLLTGLLFAVLELGTGNILEPLLFRSSTGVSSLALIGGAIFWGWLWGPVGLILSTPLTVCVAVIGKHVRRLSFLSILVGNEEPLTPPEECYHRLLVGGSNEAIALVESHIKATSLLAMYEEMLVPTVAMAERDYDRQELETAQRDKVSHGIRDIIDDLSSRPATAGKTEAGEEPALETATPFQKKSDLRVACIPARAERDELAAAMLVHLLRETGFEAVIPGLGVAPTAMAHWVKEQNFDVVCISVVPPSTVAQTRHLCTRLRQHCPALKIIVGLWGGLENLERATADLQASGADRVVVLLEAGIGHVHAYAAAVLGEMVPAPAIPDEEARLLAVRSLKAYNSKSDPVFDRMTRDLTRTFDVPIALLTLIDRDQQLFKSQFGLPAEMAAVCDLPRESSVCSHVVAANSMLVVEDLARDRRFANNPVLKQNRLRFYAGIPLHAANGQPIGALCILDTKPRSFSEAEKRMLAVMGEVMSQEISSHRAADLVIEEPAVA